ncbi:MAG: ATP-binding protein [Burkholderiaceae bacterium]
MRRRLAQAVAMGLALILTSPVSGQSNDLETLDALQTQSHRNSQQALTDLQDEAARFGASPSLEIRRTYLSTLIGLALDTGRTDIAQESAKQLSKLAREHNDDTARVLAQGFHAHRLIAEGDTAGAEAVLKEIQPIASRSQNEEALWFYHLLMGRLYNSTGDFALALENVLTSMEHARRRPRQSQASLLRSRVEQVLIYISMKNNGEAIQAIADAKPLAKRLDAFQILGALELNQGVVESRQGHLDLAMNAYSSAQQTAKRSGLVVLEAAALNNMGDIQLLRKEYALAEPLMRQAQSRYLQAGDQNGAALSQANWGFALMGLGQVNEGAKQVHAALDFLHQAGAKATEEVLLEELSRMYEQAGHFEAAMKTTRAQQVLSKALFQLEREQTVAKLQSQFDAQERQREVEHLAQENLLKDAELQGKRAQQIGLSASLVLLLAGSAVVATLYRRTRKHNLALHEAKRMAEEALQEKNLFLATASHDLRQPVHAMSLMVEAIRLRNQSEPLKPLLADLKTSMAAMSQLFNSLLDLSRLEASHSAVHMVPVPLQTAMEKVGRELRAQAHQAGLSMRIRLPRTNATVLGDPLLLHQTLTNLTHNAIRYTPPHGKVLLSARRRADDWLIEVWDTGMGIAENEKAMLFDPYVRSAQAWRVDATGHGLGLAVVARCARLMQARSGFQSRINKGSRFWLRLKAIDEQGTHGSSSVMSATSESTSTTLRAQPESLVGRCIVVDDDAAVRSAWNALFAGWGLQVRTAASGPQAHQLLDEGFAPQAIFCDQRLRHGENGFALLRSLLDRCPDASGAMVSGELASAQLLEAEELGYLVIRKPVDPHALHLMLRSWGLTSQSPSGDEQPPNGGHT